MTSTKAVNVEVEDSILGSLLLEPGRVAEAAALLQPNFFTDIRNRHVFEGMQSLAENSEPIDLITVGEALVAQGHFETVGGRARLAELAGRVTNAAHLSFHMRILGELSAVRSLESVCRLIATEALGVAPVNGNALAFLQGAIERVVGAVGIVTLDGLEMAEREARSLREKIAAGPTEGIDGLQTGFRDVDNIVCGMRPGDLVVVAARPGFGKTALAAGIAAEQSLGDSALSVAFFSLEMSKQALLERIAADFSEIDHYLIRTRRLSVASRAAVDSALSAIELSRLAIDDTPSQSLMSIRASARRHKQRFGLDLIVVDYLQLIRVKGSENRLQEVSSVSRGLKELARELQVPVIAAAQLNRAAGTGTEQRPRLSHLRESGTIESDADIVVLLHPITEPEGANDDRTVEAIIAKNRNGPVGTARLVFQPRFVRFIEEMPRIDIPNVPPRSIEQSNAATQAKAETDAFPGMERDEMGADYDH